MTQHGFLGSIQPTFEVSYIADTVILLKPVEDKGILSKTISVYKRRAGPHGKTINYFLIDPEGIFIGDPVKCYSGIIGGNPQLVTDAGKKRSKDKDE